MKIVEVGDTAYQFPPARFAAEFLIYSDILSPDDVSNRLRLQATHAATKGVKIGERTNTPVSIPRHMWQLSSEPNIVAADLDSHLSWLLAKLTPLHDQLRAIRSLGSTELCLVGRVWTSGTSAHVGIAKPTMEALLALDLELQLEFADYGHDE